MDADRNALPDDVDELKDALLVERARAFEVTAELMVVRARAAEARACRDRDRQRAAGSTFADSQTFLSALAIDGSLDLEQRVNAAHDLDLDRDGRQRDLLLARGLASRILLDVGHGKKRAPRMHPAGAAHRADDTVVGHQSLELFAGVLAAAIRMMQQRVGFAAPPDRHHQSVGDELGCHLSVHRQLAVLVFQRAQTLGIRHVHAAVLGLPIVQRGFRDAVLAGQIGRLRAGLVLAPYRDDLLLGEPDPLPSPSPF
jgi:hypothetical protein